jgi:hypothetical protein
VVESFIKIEDNFFDKNTFTKINNEVEGYEYAPPTKEIIDYNGGCFWFQNDVSKSDLQNHIIEQLEKITNLKINRQKNCISKFIMSNAQDKARPHVDHAADLQCLIYIKGDQILNNGTLFLDKKESSYDINAHVGFKENRAIIFSSNNYHSPAQFLGGTWRYSINNFFCLL